ncbi:Cas9 endonuclease PAM-interacting domain-containing protein [Pediococcus acidilactici]|nr:Cas9 endonuclease PAM-interacting domain-containing protein [Pediococcus acidilactici]
MLVSRETTTRRAELFNQTVYPKNYRGKLIPIKEDRPTDLYGGYSGNTDAYLAIVALEDKKEGQIFQGGRNSNSGGCQIREVKATRFTAVFTGAS